VRSTLLIDRGTKAIRTEKEKEKYKHPKSKRMLYILVYIV